MYCPHHGNANALEECNALKRSGNYFISYTESMQYPHKCNI